MSVLVFKHLALNIFNQKQNGKQKGRKQLIDAAQPHRQKSTDSANTRDEHLKDVQLFFLLDLTIGQNASTDAGPKIDSQLLLLACFVHRSLKLFKKHKTLETKITGKKRGR